MEDFELDILEVAGVWIGARGAGEAEPGRREQGEQERGGEPG